MNPGFHADRRLTDELVGVLDEEIDLLNRKRGELETLCQAVTERDDERMGALIEQMEQTHRDQRAADVKLDALRGALARSRGVAPGDMSLSVLIDSMQEQESLALEYRRQQIVILADELRRKHVAAAMLLAESARINRMFLDRLTPQSQSVETYSAKGAKSWRDGTGIVDAEL